MAQCANDGRPAKGYLRGARLYNRITHRSETVLVEYAATPKPMCAKCIAALRRKAIREWVNDRNIIIIMDVVKERAELNNGDR